MILSAGMTVFVTVTHFCPPRFARKLNNMRRKEGRKKKKMDQQINGSRLGGPANTPEPEEPDPERGPEPEPVRGAQPPGLVAERPAAQNAIAVRHCLGTTIACFGILRIGRIPIPYPFPYVPIYIIETPSVLLEFAYGR